MSRARVCFLEGLSTITSIVEGFGGVPSKTKSFQMTQGGYQVIIILAIKCKMAAAK